MIGIIILTHGGLAKEFEKALEHVIGAQEQIISIGIEPEDDLEARRTELMEAVSAVDTGDGVIVLSDMFGGTPSNLAMSLLNRENTEVIAGVNLPVLIKLASIRSSTDLQQAANDAQEAGRKYINAASQLLEGA
ncbi:MAG: PTS sugar transporter subunit IIA [Alphaproteobacteria bacterium]